MFLVSQKCLHYHTILHSLVKTDKFLPHFQTFSSGGVQACQGPGDGEQGGVDPRHPHQGGGGCPHQAQDEQQQGQERKGSRLVRLLILYQCTVAN